MITYLNVTDENVEDLRDLGITCDVDDEIECAVDYEVNRADRSVGIMSDDVQVYGVTCDGIDVTRFFDEDDLHDQVRDEYEAQCESMADDAESMRDRMYD